MIAWKNFDQTQSYAKLLALKDHVCLPEVMSGENGAKRVAAYSVPMAAGLAYNYAAKAVDDDVLSALQALAEETQLLEKYESLYNGDMINEQLLNLLANPDPAYVSHYLAQNVRLSVEDRQLLLEERFPTRRLALINRMLTRELSILSIEKELSDQTQEAMNRSQRDYYLREEMKIIQAELGEEGGVGGDAGEAEGEEAEVAGDGFAGAGDGGEFGGAAVGGEGPVDGFDFDAGQGVGAEESEGVEGPAAGAAFEVAGGGAEHLGP